MELKLDHRSPVPLYHQIVECLRYRIATGQVCGGDPLPPLRIAAAHWGVNLHTVRRAYGELAAEGLILIRRPQGASVAVGPGFETSSIRLAELQRFVTETSRRARQRFGLSPAQLSELLLGSPASVGGSQEEPAAAFVECNALQASDYATQIESHWSVQICPWALERSGEPPSGAIISTFFHFNEVRARWPRRHADMRFVPVQLDHSLLDLLLGRADHKRPVRIILAEQTEERAREILGDLMGLLPPDRASVVVRTVKRPGSLLKRRKNGPFVLFAPRIWSRLTIQQRSHPRAVQLRYLVEADSLADLAKELGWRRRKESLGRAM
jgi:DNA-binding transcriptional regulator YhcF (GntR family)